MVRTMKKRKCMADGGILMAGADAKETPEEMLARMNAKYGLGDAGKPAPQPSTAAPAPAPQPTTQPSQQGIAGGLFGKMIDAVGRRADEQNRVSRYARGGIMPVIGAGSGTSDSVPVIVAGQKVRLSNGEGVAVLPAKTMKNDAAVVAIEDIIEATNGRRPVKVDNELSHGGGHGEQKAFFAGAVSETEEEKRRQSSAPTAKEVYSPAYGAASGIMGALQSLPEGGVVRRAVQSGESVPGAIGRALVEGGGMPNGGLFGPPGARLKDSMRVAQMDSQGASPTPAAQQQLAITDPAVAPQSAARPAVAPQQASYSNNTGTGDTGNANFNPQSGILAFTDKTFDPTKQMFQPGTGAITNPRTGKTMMLAPQEAGASGIAGAPLQQAGAGSTDAYGNSTARTDQMKSEIAQLQATGNQPDGPRVSMLQSLPAEQADRHRFANFVRQSDADRLAHDLGTGGGNDRTNAGKIAALNAMRQGIADDLGRKTQVDVAGIQGASLAAVEGQRGMNQLANTRLAGQNQLATTDLLGQNALAVESVRQSSPENVLSAVKTQGEIEDARAQREARNGVIAAIKTGDPGKINEAWRMGIAAGIVKPEREHGSFKTETGIDGSMTRTNQHTGDVERYNGQTKTWERLGGGTPSFEVKSGMPVDAPDGTHTFQGRTITVKAGKVIEVK